MLNRKFIKPVFIIFLLPYLLGLNPVSNANSIDFILPSGKYLPNFTEAQWNNMINTFVKKVVFQNYSKAGVHGKNARGIDAELDYYFLANQVYGTTRPAGTIIAEVSSGIPFDLVTSYSKGRDHLNVNQGSEFLNSLDGRQILFPHRVRVRSQFQDINFADTINPINFISIKQSCNYQYNIFKKILNRLKTQYNIVRMNQYSEDYHIWPTVGKFKIYDKKSGVWSYFDTDCEKYEPSYGENIISKNETDIILNAYSPAAIKN